MSFGLRMKTDRNERAAPNYAVQQVSLNGSGVVVATSTALTANPTFIVAGGSVALTATVSAGGSRYERHGDFL